MINKRVANQKTAQQSVHPTLGIRRDFQAFFWLRVFPALKHFPRPPSAGNANRWAVVLQKEFKELDT
jgi:hypothetical protein